MSPRHVVVIGAGITGSAVAFRLAQSGLRVTLVDSDPPGSHASGKNAGHLNPIYLTPPPLVPFALESFHLHTRLAEDLAALDCPDFRREPIRRILLALHAGEERDFVAVRELFKGHDAFPTRLLDRKALRSLEPRITPDAIGGLLLEGTLAVDPRALTCSLAAGAGRLGVQWTQARVDGLKTRDRCVHAVCAGGINLSCDDVVLATGPWIEETEKWLGVQLPVKPVKGQLLRMRAPRGGLSYDLSRGNNALYRRGHDEVWVGGTEEEAGFDASPTPEAREKLLSAAVRLMPEMAGAQVLEHTAAFRPATPDRLPLVKRVEGWKNVILANGGGNKGVLLCTGMAERVRDLLCGEIPESSTFSHCT